MGTIEDALIKAGRVSPEETVSSRRKAEAETRRQEYLRKTQERLDNPIPVPSIEPPPTGRIVDTSRAGSNPDDLVIDDSTATGVNQPT